MTDKQRQTFLKPKESNSVSSLNKGSANEQVQDRETWGGKFEFILSCIGYAVGLGTIWRFPYVCYRNGGGAFLVPYIIYMILLGMPLVLLELGYGQFSSLSPIAVWRMSPLFQGVGYGMVIISAIVCVYYNVIISWTLYYFVRSFASPLPWSHCNNTWNTELCSTREEHNATNFTALNVSVEVVGNTMMPRAKLRTPSEEFYEFEILGMRDGYDINNIGYPRWQLVIALLAAWIFIFACLCKGVKTSGKVVYVTATMPYVLLLVFLIRGVTLPGAATGIEYYIVPNFERLLSFQPWAEAAQQLFYSMGAAWGALITMSSYNKFNNNFYRDGIFVSIADTLTALLVGFVIFSTLGFMAEATGSTIEEVVVQGPGLIFIVLPEAITHMPGATFWAVVFFIFIFLVGVDSQFGMFETVLSAMFDQFPSLRRQKILVTGLMSIAQFLLGLPLITTGGIYVFQILDWYCSTFSLMVLTLAECVVISWVYGTERFYRDMTMMLGFRPNPWWGICWMFITPTLNIFVLMINVVKHSPVTYGAYSYPWWAIFIGWILALVSIVPIPVVAIIKICQSKTPGSTKQKIWELMKPHKDWGPADFDKLEKYLKMTHSPSATEKLLTGSWQMEPAPSQVFVAPETIMEEKVENSIV